MLFTFWVTRASSPGVRDTFVERPPPQRDEPAGAPVEMYPAEAPARVSVAVG